MHTISRRQSVPLRSPRIRLPRLGWASALAERFLEWHERSRQRQTLEMLDDYALKDIGLTRADVFREAHKRFWQD